MEFRVEYPSLSLHDLQSIAIERDLNQPDSATIMVEDRLASIGKSIVLGKELKIFGQAPGAKEEELLFHGELLAMEYQSQHSTLLVQLRAYGLMHRLARRKVAAAMPVEGGSKQIKAVIEELIKGSEVLVGTVASVQTQVSRYAHLQTPLDVLGAMAYEEGCALWMGDQGDAWNELMFDKVPVGSDAVATFVPRADMKGTPFQSARAEVSMVRYPSSIEVRGWNAKEQKKIVGTAAPGDVASACKAAFPMALGASPHLQSEADLLADGDAKTRAANLMQRAAAAAGTAEVSLDTLPPAGLGLGMPVELRLHQETEDPMGGKYFVRGLRITQRGLATTSIVKLSRHVVPK